jgi:hypothetical protein
MPEAQPDEVDWLKSYVYVRTAMVGLLVGLGAAVLYQTGSQGWHLLDSVSAYYYTPAQAIFVGSLIGLGACMIALRGTNDVEDVFLDIGGMLAAVVAIVPTARSKDYETAVRACRHSGSPPLTHRASPILDCPTVEALARATRDNIENNMTALLVVGVLGLLATVLFALRYQRPAGTGAPPKGLRPTWWGFALALLVWVAGAVGFWAYLDWFIDHAHYVAAGGLFVCIVVVALANVFRRQGKVTPATLLARRDPYGWLGLLMVGVAVVMGVLVLVHLVSLFWLEISVTFLFLVFWTVQTVEQLPPRAAPGG